MRKRILKGMLVYVTILSVLTMSSTYQTSTVYASENTGQSEVTVEPAGTTPPGNEGETPVISDTESEEKSYYSLTASQTNVSFGTLYAGDYVKEQPITITNNGPEDIYLIWNEADPDDIFKVDMPYDLYLPAGNDLTFYVTPRTDVDSGNYSTGILLGDVDDTSFQYGIELSFSVTIKTPEPYIDSVQVNPGAVSLTKGASYSFSTFVTGGNNPDYSVDWKLSGAQMNGTGITGDGKLIIAADETASQLTVTAISRQTPSVSGSAVVSITADDHNVTVKASPAEGGQVAGGGTVRDGGSTTVWASANNGYFFQGWNMDGQTVSQGNTYQLSNIKKDTQLTAIFARSSVNVSINMNRDNGGRVTGGGTIAYGGSMALSAEPASGFIFSGWQENGNIISRDQNFQLTNVTTDRKITACFDENKKQVVLAVSPSDMGQAKGQGSYAAGSDVKVTASAYRGYQFVNWTLNGNVVSTEPEYTISRIDQDYCLTANFMKQQAKTYEMNAAVETGNGQIYPAGKVMVPEDGTLVYTITPQNGYKISGVTVNGQAVGAVTSYTFTKINAGHTIKASFVQKENAVNSAATPSPKASPSPSKTQSAQPEPAKTPAAATTPEPTEEDGERVETASEEDAGEEVDLDTLTGILQTFNITRPQAAELIRSGRDAELLQEAYYEGYLKLTINNQYAGSTQETADGSFIENPSLPNFGEIFSTVITPGEKLDLFEGKADFALNINISDYSRSIPSGDKAAIEREAGEKYDIGNYFDIIFMKTFYGQSQFLTKLEKELEIVINVPEELKKSGRNFSVIRVHDDDDGTQTVTVLKDLDNNPDTVTFRTDCFSAFALVYGAEKASLTPRNMIALLIVLILMALSVSIVVHAAGNSFRRKRNRRRGRLR